MRLLVNLFKCVANESVEPGHYRVADSIVSQLDFVFIADSVVRFHVFIL